jgi:hypothetical protein
MTRWKNDFDVVMAICRFKIIFKHLMSTTNLITRNGKPILVNSKGRKYIETKSRDGIVYICSDMGCVSNNQRGGLFGTHNPKKVKVVVPVRYCKTTGCSNRVIRMGGCGKHGGHRVKCAAMGCENKPHKYTFCISHQDKRPSCKYPGCTKTIRSKNLCVGHGAPVKRCKVDGCKLQACTGGVCNRHGSIVRYCTVDGCTTPRLGGGLCMRHGAPYTRCTITGCDGRPVSRGGVSRSWWEAT